MVETQESPTVGERLNTRKRRVSPYERMKHAIVVGELEPGQQMVESVLAQWYDVSRTPVREALTRLEQDGLVERTERGLVVRDSSPEEILDVYDCKIVVEALAASTAAERRTERDIFALRRAAEKFGRLVDAEPDELAETNLEFHRTLGRAGHNESLIDIQERLSLHLGRYPQTTLAYPGRHSRATAEHHMLVDAIEERDADLAASIARQHMSNARDIRMRLWESE